MSDITRFLETQGFGALNELGVTSSLFSVLELRGKHIHNKQLQTDITVNSWSQASIALCFHFGMASKRALTFLLLQVLAMELSSGRQMPSPSRHEAFSKLSKSSFLDFPRNRNSPTRGRRCLGTALSLLWPQVVGPVDQGLIEERNYLEVPKTLLEHRLELLRRKAQEEEQSRLVVRNYIKKLTEAQDEFYGFSNGNLPADDYT